MGLLYLAKQDKRRVVSTLEVAKAIDVPAAFLSNMLMELGKVGIIIPYRGTHGGFILSRSPEFITIREVIEATKGPYNLVNCIHDPGCCDRYDSCTIRDVLIKINDQLRDVIDKFSLKDFLDSI